jgi:hypothetical protein
VIDPRTARQVAEGFVELPASLSRTSLVPDCRRGSPPTRGSPRKQPLCHAGMMTHRTPQSLYQIFVLSFRRPRLGI